MGFRMSLRKDVRKLLKLAMKQGFVVEKSPTTGHYKVVAPSGAIFGVLGTPSDPLSLKRIKPDFKRHGLLTTSGKGAA
jgi:hypothetical protein